MKWAMEFQTPDGEWHKSSITYDHDPFMRAYSYSKATGIPYRTFVVEEKSK